MNGSTKFFILETILDKGQDVAKFGGDHVKSTVR